MSYRRRFLLTTAALLGIAAVGMVTVVAPVVDRRMNTVIPGSDSMVSAAALALHHAATIVDLHADALLWQRDLNDRHAHGHVDLPRLRDGHVGLQVFSVVTKTPRGINYERNTGETDNITLLAMAERYPPRAWRSLRERALWQARRFDQMAGASAGALRPVRTVGDLDRLLSARAGGTEVIGGILATEGLHPAEGVLENVDTLFAAGFRIFGLTHFFDNEVGGSAHGVSRGGLTAFGRTAIDRIAALGGVVDVAHASPALLDDVLGASAAAVMVSHTGVQGTCPGPRNLSDDQLRAIAARGGLVGIGFWDGAICEVSAASFARAVRHALAVAGDSVVALGSDFDGATRMPFDVSGIPRLTEAMLHAGLTPEQVRAVLGENAVAFLRRHLPP
ncbi:MAG: membrane dipeptidase [Gemmatimonadetes bacterium]|nr:membrane dipeptidase [Gemmatimonadota bacterium]